MADSADPSLSRPAWQIVWTLAWPAVALNSLQTINSLLDSYFVQTLPPGALTALGGSTNAIFLFISLSFMMGTAATAFVSRFHGAKDHEGCRTAARKSVSLALYLGLFLVLLALPAAYGASKLFVPADDKQAQSFMVQYLLIFALSLPAVNLIQCLAGCLRGVGDTVSPMILSGFQILLHILLNWILIFPGHQVGPVWLPGANWGLAGAAASLSISNWAAALAYLLWVRKTTLGISLRFPWPGWDWTKRILRVAVPSGLLSILRVTSLMAFTVILTQVPGGSSAIAAMRVGFSIESLAFMPAFGLSIAASALVGQSLGMKDPDRASRLGWTAGHHAAAVSTVAAALLFVFAHPVASLIVPDQPEVAAIAANYIMFICATETFFGYAMVMIGAMQGAGDTVRPMWLTLITMWFLRVPLAAVLALPWGFNMGANGCWLAMAITQLAQGIAAMAMFHRGAWRTVRV